MSDTINRLYENQFGTSPKTQQDADDYASMMNVWSNTKDPEEFAQAERNINVEGRMDENPNAGMLKYTYATADATGVAHDNIDNILVGNRQDKLEKLIEREGSIRALPYISTAEGQQTMLDMAMGSAMPGAAIGRVSKAAATGGRRLLSKDAKWYKDLINNMYKDITDPKTVLKKVSGGKYESIYGTKVKFPKAYMKAVEKGNSKIKKDIRDLQKDYKKRFDSGEFTLERTQYNKDLSSNRLSMEKALDKHNVKHNLPEVNDPLTEILRAVRFRKN